MEKRRWHLLEAPPASFFDSHTSLPKLLLTLLHHRNITEPAAIDAFLHPDYAAHIHDPYLFKDMTIAVDRLLQAIEKDERITIHGDYDADGVSASVILSDTLEAMGSDKVDCFLPHRETDGYGLSSKTVDFLHSQETKVIITCDCGISNYDAVAHANELGVDVIITDHHSIPAKVPDALAIIHPKIETEKYPDKNLAGGGVAFKLAQGLLKKHKELGKDLRTGETHEGFEKWQLGMAAIASVADMVPLIGESRVLTNFGLRVLNQTRRVGMKKLYIESGLADDLGNLEKPITERTIGFTIAPRINAAGRLDHANVAYNLIKTDRGTDAVDLAYQLEQNNSERRTQTQEAIELADKIITEQEHRNVVVVFFDHWRPGIVGLIASKLKDRLYQPIIVATMNGDVLVGSGRSITGFSLIGALQEHPELFSKFGGHPMACGFSLADGVTIDQLRDAVNDSFEKNASPEILVPEISIDAEANFGDLSLDIFKQLSLLEPYGQKNPAPRYVTYGAEVHNVQFIGQQNTHVKMVLKHSGKMLTFLGWGLAVDEAYAWIAKAKEGDNIDVVYTLSKNSWNGRHSLQCQIIDIKQA
ncbi:MAG: single-stranded-DNA-specific exonuclease RecJ [Candidatus Magasanikbacteria bacterium]|jgi:single-stranded-DNA-specific exonuclease|nr:single-stranded-DNA-specific exonuclease RecJ [Candidatus Magasanikbacteria bacterium]